MCENQTFFLIDDFFHELINISFIILTFFIMKIPYLKDKTIQQEQKKLSRTKRKRQIENIRMLYLQITNTQFNGEIYYSLHLYHSVSTAVLYMVEGMLYLNQFLFSQIICSHYTIPFHIKRTPFKQHSAVNLVISRLSLIGFASTSVLRNNLNI